MREVTLFVLFLCLYKNISPCAKSLLRILNAQMLLETTDGTVSEIARIVGYDNPMYFSRVFRKEKGTSPAKYRKVYREKGLPD